MHKFSLALLGFGNVGKALARLLLAKKAELERKYGITWKVVGIATGSHGVAIDHNGIDLNRFPVEPSETINLEEFSTMSDISNSLEFIEQCRADVLFETTPVNYDDGQPAISYLQRAIELGMHAITANKGPVVHGFRDLTALALSNDVHFLFESAVMDGAPIFSLWREALSGAELLSFRGILNSTTNLILSLMEQGVSLNESVKQAQKMGIAETDPTGDIDGWDAAVKVAALVTVLMDTPCAPNQVKRKGIGDISAEMVQRSMEEGRRWKLICEAQMMDDGLQAAVYPDELTPEDPLFNVMGTSSSVTFNTDVLGALTIIEEDPGTETTAYGMLADFINAVRN
jgi:homoserine dehydrogenase